MISSKITGTGSFIPSIKKENNDFLDTHFLNEDGSHFSSENDVIIEKFKNITGIAERRYAKPEYKTWWLALIDNIGNGLSEKEKSQLRESIDFDLNFDKVFIISYLKPIKGGEI